MLPMTRAIAMPIPISRVTFMCATSYDGRAARGELLDEFGGDFDGHTRRRARDSAQRCRADDLTRSVVDEREYRAR
jgi:hypothetical protein